MTTPADLRRHIAALTAQLAGRPLDSELDAWLNREHGADSATYRALKAGCEAGVAAGRPAGWCVYGPGSAHRPTVSAGRALVLYLLPQGKIEFTR